MKIDALHPFGAVCDIDLRTPLSDAQRHEMLEAFDEYSILVFKGQSIDDAQQIRFSENFGVLERTIAANPAGGSAFARQSNLDIETGQAMPPEDVRMRYQLGNHMWHSDSSFKATPSLCSILSARILPPTGGETEFANTRLAYAALAAGETARLEGLQCEHSLSYSRAIVAPDLLTRTQREEVPPVTHPLVRSNPRHGRRALFIGAHASRIVDWPLAQGRALLGELLSFATQRQFQYVHHWEPGDVVVWDNRCCLHRATPYDAIRYKRLMQRTTVAGRANEPGYEQIEREPTRQADNA
ncbi:MAG: TauD/TfdA family dioxygenase [Gammaproteobacteria bacterium]|nr:TauD/TfdA family dioxygenase [Gammaproteobacteria bacterium]